MKHYAIEDVWGGEVQLHALLTSALDGGEWSTSLPCHFTPWEITPGTHSLGSWVGPRVGVEAVEKRTSLLLLLKRILKKQDGVVRAGFIWLKIGTSGRLLRIQ
jgi:hypothetical protein